MVRDNVMRYIKTAYRSSDREWRVEGINVARSFFHLAAARKKLLTDFVGSVLLITMGEETQEKYQLLASETFCHMSDYKEFEEELCATSVLNFLCIVLNQVAEAEEIVTHCFKKLSQNPDNLVVLVEGSVGDSLETFFKTVDYSSSPDAKKRSPEKLRTITALAYCANTLGTLIKYGYVCQVETSNVLKIYQTTTSTSLEAEVARLFFWICRHASDRLEDALSEAGTVPEVMECLATVWNTRCHTHHVCAKEWNGTAVPPQNSTFGQLCHVEGVTDVEGVRLLAECIDKRTTYLNALLWVCLPFSRLRGLLKTTCGGVTKLYLAFELRQEQYVKVVIGTCRHLLDYPLAQNCNDLIKFIGEQLLVLLNEVLGPQNLGWSEDLVQLLLDSIAIFAMQRDMMELLAQHHIWLKCKHACEDVYKDNPRIQLACLRLLSVISMHPSHRIHWIGEIGKYPPREEFIVFLGKRLQASARRDDSVHILASLLITVFQEEKFMPQNTNMEEIKDIIFSLVAWWRKNTSARYEEEKELAEEEAKEEEQTVIEEINADDILQRVRNGKMKRNTLTVMEALPYCAPYESLVVLALLGRLALEPMFKPILAKEQMLKALLACVASGIWAEARDAAAILANLLWYGGLREEHLLCWLKFDRSVAADSSNVLLPIKTGNPKLVDVGNGLGVENWGVEFNNDSSVILHPDALKTHKVPGILLSASPSDTFSTTSATFQSITKTTTEKNWTISAWFWWPLSGGYIQRRHVFVESKKETLIWCNMRSSGNGTWCFRSTDGSQKELTVPPMSPGWHMIAVVSSTTDSPSQFNGTKLSPTRPSRTCTRETARCSRTKSRGS
eukprot:GEMP01013155.1.p1 GENE.GEMP01013155.1~~GEMP01013155.1.p1  ORF type:complete len:842 (+),score=156.75 GEMP01013155.1:58-2583(+)